VYPLKLPLGAVSFLLLVHGAGPASAQQQSTKGEAHISVAVRAEGGGQVEAPYVAVVPEDRAFDEPLFEEILGPAGTQDFLLPSGRYRIVSSAPGFEMEVSAALDLQASTSSSQTVELRRLLRLKGRILDPEGKPVVGAAVGHWDSFLDFPRRLSPLALSHLGSNRRTVSREDGSFELPAVPGARHLVWIEATGFEPGVLQDVLFDPPRYAGPWEVRLQRGASLEVSWEGEPGPAGRRLLLKPKEADGEGLKKLAESLTLWERPVEGGRQSWPSLPAGRYELWLRPARRGAHQSVPVLLATATLAAGGGERLTVRLPEAPGDALRGPGEAPGLRLLVLDQRPKDLDGLRVTRWSPEGESPQAVELSRVSGGTRLELAGGCRPEVDLVVEAPGRIGAVRQEQEPPCSEAPRVALSPAASYSGVLTPPSRERLPGQGFLVATRCPDRTMPVGNELGRFPFRIHQDGRFEAQAPAGCLSLSLQVGDYARLTIGPLDVPAGKSKTLGILRLSAGGALVARVVSGENGLPLDGVAVTPVPATDLSGAVRAAFSRGRTAGIVSAMAGRTVQGGWVRFFGLEPGDYFLRLDAPGRRWPHFEGPFGVRRLDEALLDEVVLPPPASLQVELAPSDSLARAAKAFRVEARSAEPDAGWPSVQLLAEAAPQGLFQFPEIPPGRWKLLVLGELPPGPALVEEQDVTVQAGRSNTVVVPLDATMFRGVVTYLGDPVEGSLTLTPLRLEKRRRVSVRLSEEGRFEVLLDQPGFYDARVSDRQGRLARATVSKVAFLDPEDEVRLEIPAGRISGRVVDSGGSPVPNARVEIRAYRGPEDTETPSDLRLATVSARTGPDGSYALEGVEAGECSLGAHAGERGSVPRPLQLRADERIEGVDLEILDPELVSGVVLDELGRPLAGTEGRVSFAPAAGRAPRQDAAWVSDREGRFTFDAAGFVGSDANFSLRTASGTVSAQRHRLSDGLVLQVSERSGEAQIRLAPEDGWDRLSPFGLWLVRDDGSFIAPKLIPAAEDRQVRVLSGLAPGRWRLVSVGSGDLVALLLAGGGVQLPSITTFDVVPGQRVVVDVASTKRRR
jgi:hypothetical protein